MNTITYQFVSVTANGSKTVCTRHPHAACTDYLIIGLTEYSGNTQVEESPKQFVLVGARRSQYHPATVRQASKVVSSSRVLLATQLLPDNDGDFVSGVVVFMVRRGAARFSFLWQGVHVATFVENARGKLSESR